MKFWKLKNSKIILKILKGTKGTKGAKKTKEVNVANIEKGVNWAKGTKVVKVAVAVVKVAVVVKLDLIDRPRAKMNPIRYCKMRHGPTENVRVLSGHHGQVNDAQA